MDDLFELVRLMAVAIIALFIIGTAVIYPLSAYNCSIKGDLYGVETKHNFSGCFVKTEHSYVPMKLYEKSVMEITNINLLRK